MLKETDEIVKIILKNPALKAEMLVAARRDLQLTQVSFYNQSNLSMGESPHDMMKRLFTLNSLREKMRDIENLIAALTKE